MRWVFLLEEGHFVGLGVNLRPLLARKGACDIWEGPFLGRV